MNCLTLGIIRCYQYYIALVTQQVIATKPTNSFCCQKTIWGRLPSKPHPSLASNPLWPHLPFRKDSLRIMTDKSRADLTCYALSYFVESFHTNMANHWDSDQLKQIPQLVFFRCLDALKPR